MFKKPLSNLKTSAPLRSSDRRKLKQRVVASYALTPEEGDLLVPDGILSVKFLTHVNEPGVAYLGPDGDPLWFTIGKGSDGDLIPTVYTLWKKQDLLPFLSTPSVVVPILIGGADLMIPGVIHCPPSLPDRNLICIRQYSRKDTQSPPALSPPVAVGWLALPSDRLRSAASNSKEEKKGKAVLVAHTWKDHLWDMGSKRDMPEDTVLQSSTEPSSAAAAPAGSAAPSVNAPTYTYTPTEISHLLTLTLLQAISSTLGPLPPSAFPIPATQFYSTYILPSRPAFPWVALRPSSSSSSSLQGASSPTLTITPESTDGTPPVVGPEISIKSSTHKSLTAFLKSCEKLSLLTLKPAPQNKAEVVITSVNASHPSVAGHTLFVTIGEVEGKGGEVEVRELWKANQGSVDLAEGIGGSKSDLYTALELRSLLNAYIISHNLVNPHEQAYINLDELLYSCLRSAKIKTAKSKGKSRENERDGSGEKDKHKDRAKDKDRAKAKDKDKAKDTDGEDMDRFLRRDELMKAVLGKMQAWYEVRVEGGTGLPRPIQIHIKMRQGRKACTLITGFEPFQVVDADEMAEALRRVCAGATSVSPLQGKSPSGQSQPQMEVLVQGKQAPAVVEYLMGKGIPKRWIEVVDSVGKK
ncbi:hypothetical protein CPB84DRAFT_1814350 [Gymnopilus junonius]|uniref:SUI1 domain-containing protein n=1 Tax=Gymnopilus junonius TaxID=109634 RepID=A0A9P5NS11_GYMJU|nr:hypothetical protein CPB84DRAFT_1814350 [Gymnopilus junonius]